MCVDLITFAPDTHHVCQSNVEEHSPSQGKDPVRGEAVAGQYAKAHAEITATSWQEVKEQSLLYAHSSVQQDHKVPWMTMRGNASRGCPRTNTRKSKISIPVEDE